MSRDNPFEKEEPSDLERTIVIPSPGGRAAAVPSGDARGAMSGHDRAAPAETPAAETPAELGAVGTGVHPLLAAAAPLLQLLARLRSLATAPDAGALRDRAAAEMRRFERVAQAGGVGIEMLREAHFALCAALDDVALATRWGGQGPWAAKPLTVMFHRGVVSGEQFFTQLARLGRTPAAMLPLLELMHICLSLGMAGQYRAPSRGPAEVERVREELYALIMRHRPPAEAALSPRIRGVAAPWRPGGTEVPIWVAGAAALAAVALLYAWVVTSLGADAGAVQAQAARLPLAHMPAIVRAAPITQPPPAEPGVLQRLRTFLAPEVAARLVTIDGTEAVPIVRIFNRGMFASGSAAPDPRWNGLLARIGAALRTEPGPVTVAGYTDDRQIHTVRFPSNLELSQARAAAAAAVIGQALEQPGRIAAQGRAEADPIGDNATEAGREANRRIEVILRRQAPAPL